MGVKIDCSPGALPLASWIRAGEFYADQLIGAPNELGSKDAYSDNALPRIRAWQKDLQAGEAPNSTIKIFFLGNGRVGKTQICRRLLGKPFDPSVPTTHGIDLAELRIVPASGSLPEIMARLWDFGGQSIYHGTHGLFIDDRAIYVLAWTPLYENTDEIEQDGIAMRNRRLRYWLEYVSSLAGQSAPVIVSANAVRSRKRSPRTAPYPRSMALNASSAPMAAQRNWMAFAASASSSKAPPFTNSSVMAKSACPKAGALSSGKSRRYGSAKRKPFPTRNSRRFPAKNTKRPSRRSCCIIYTAAARFSIAAELSAIKSLSISTGRLTEFTPSLTATKRSPS